MILMLLEIVAARKYFTFSLLCTVVFSYLLISRIFSPYVYSRISQINFDKNHPARDKRARDFNKHSAQLIGN